MDQHRSRLIREILEGASMLHGEDRTRFLSAKCRDSDLRLEVERLLQAIEPTEVLVEDGTEPLSQFAGLAPGERLGHYLVGKRLGAGGMGWVYEATDEKLRRLIAIKVLPPGEITDENRKRFAREAQSASALNHPNIITVYEVGREGDIDYIAMERVHGETLGRKIGKKGIECRGAVRLAAQIADALAAAHDAGIVHRDLKPGNVMVTERGLVKVLDFGLAKQAPGSRGDYDSSTSQTSLSSSGQVIGTLSYMSPEQASGKPVDTRSDVFSFGSVLFEMIAGQRAFQADGLRVLAAIVESEPAFGALPANTPVAVRRILRKCLAKDPAERWQHMADVKQLLEDIGRDLESATPEAPKPRSRRWPPVAAAAVFGAAAFFLANRYVFNGEGSAPVEPVIRMLTSDTGLSAFPALSRDGRLVAYASDRSNEGNLDIWVQQIGGRDAIRVTKDASDESDPDFSPDGTRIAFRSEKDGGGIYVAPSFGTERAVLVAPGGRNPKFSPDGKVIAYWMGRAGSTYYPGSARLYVVDSGGGPARPLHSEKESLLFPVWSPRGNEVIALGNVGGVQDWFVVPVDGSGIRKTGARAALKAQGLVETLMGLNVRSTPLQWVDNTIYFASPMGDVANLWRIEIGSDRQVRGPARRLTLGPGRQLRAALANAGENRLLAFSDEEMNYDIWSMTLDPNTGMARGEPARLTEEHSLEWAPTFSEDGKTMAFISRRAGSWLVRIRNVATGQENTAISSPTTIVNAYLSGDGKRLFYSNTDYHLMALPANGGAVTKLCDACGTLMGASHTGSFVTYEPRTDEDLVALDSETGKPVVLANRPDKSVILSGGKFCRDEHWVAFHSIHNSGGTSQVWIAPVHAGAPASRQEWIALTEPNGRDRDPSWAANGSLIYFLSDRDGFRCIWARNVDKATKRPLGPAFAIRHFHTARRSLDRLGSYAYLTGLSVGGNQMLFALGELTGNIWLSTQPQRN